MASSMFSNPDDHPLPAEGSLYYDYLEDMPVGLTMSFDLVPDAEELDEEDREAVLFTAKKTSVGKWVGVPYKTGAVSTKILFDHVRECLPGEETMVVTLGCDPRKVKKEYVERGEEEAEESSPIIMSIHDAILIDSDAEDENVAAVELQKRTVSKAMFEKVPTFR